MLYSELTIAQQNEIENIKKEISSLHPVRFFLDDDGEIGYLSKGSADIFMYDEDCLIYLDEE